MFRNRARKREKEGHDHRQLVLSGAFTEGAGSVLHQFTEISVCSSRMLAAFAVVYKCLDIFLPYFPGLRNLRNLWFILEK